MAETVSRKEALRNSLEFLKGMDETVKQNEKDAADILQKFAINALRDCLLRAYKSSPMPNEFIELLMVVDAIIMEDYILADAYLYEGLYARNPKSILSLATSANKTLFDHHENRNIIRDRDIKTTEEGFLSKFKP